MSKWTMSFHIGDPVVHWSYGPGKIIQMDENTMSGNTEKYYVVQIEDMKIWVPLTEAGEHSLRFPTPVEDFRKLFGILSSSSEPLSADRYTRKTQLMDLLKDRTLKSICRVVRGLVDFQRTNKTNENDRSILDHARKFLLSEWSCSLSIPFEQAESELRQLLKENVV